MVDKILSIIIPSYNMEAYLPKCLESLIIDDKELMQRLEVIVVNDGSKDRTGEIAHDFEAKYPGVFRVIDKPNGNYGSCINAALPIATGKYVKILDADDSFDTINLSMYLKYLCGLCEDVDLVITDYDTVDENGNVTEQTRFTYPKEEFFGMDKILSMPPPFIFMHAITYRTKILIDSGYRQIEGISYTDMEWSCLPFAQVGRISYFPYMLYKYLLGRAGQTVDRVKYVANVWMHGKVAVDVLGSKIYKSLEGKSSAHTYIDRVIEYMLKCFYATIMQVSDPKVIDKCILMDKALKDVSQEFYRVTNGWFISRHVRFHYVRAWRSGYSVKTLKFVLFKAYYRLAQFIGSVIHK